jgi:hypothetical protein
MELSKELVFAVDYLIRENLREEAKNILVLTTDKNRKEFLEYYSKDEGNICCLVLDFAKRELIKEGKMKQRKNDGFGKPFN